MLANMCRTPKRWKATFPNIDKEIINELIHLCPSINHPEERLNQTCMDALDGYFLPRSIREETLLRHYSWNKVHQDPPLLNRRSNYLKYSSDEYQSMSPPVWGDIVGDQDQMARRHMVVAQVFRDQVCRSLSDYGTIQHNLAQRCHARELFKYATYLDVCVTGVPPARLS